MQLFRRAREAAACAWLALGPAVFASPAGAAPIHATTLAQADARLAGIGYRLAAANASRCERAMMMTGLSMHDLGGYNAASRPALAAGALRANGFGVLDLVPGSAAERAGIRAGDEITVVNGVALAGFAPNAIGRRASYARTDAFVTMIDTALRVGPATVTLRRGDAQITVKLAADAGCGGQVTVQPGRSYNAWSDGKYVAVTTRLMSSVENDDELAFVIAHEMAHNILQHERLAQGRSALFAKLGVGAGRLKAAEIEADRLAVQLLADGGFDLGAPERFLRQAAPARWADLAVTHPGIRRRIAIVDSALVALAALADVASLDATFAAARETGARVEPISPGLSLASVFIDSPTMNNGDLGGLALFGTGAWPRLDGAAGASNRFGLTGWPGAVSASIAPVTSAALDPTSIDLRVDPAAQAMPPAWPARSVPAALSFSVDSAPADATVSVASAPTQGQPAQRIVVAGSTSGKGWAGTEADWPAGISWFRRIVLTL